MDINVAKRGFVIKRGSIDSFRVDENSIFAMKRDDRMNP